MKHTRDVDHKYIELRTCLRFSFRKKLRNVRANFLAAMDGLKKRRQEEIDALPDIAPPKERNREDSTERQCASCGGALITATIENAKALHRIHGKRSSDGQRESSWQYKLAGLRNARKKYCCYACQVGRLEQSGHSARCTLRDEIFPKRIATTQVNGYNS